MKLTSTLTAAIVSTMMMFSPVIAQDNTKPTIPPYVGSCIMGDEAYLIATAPTGYLHIATVDIPQMDKGNKASIFSSPVTDSYIAFHIDPDGCVVPKDYLVMSAQQLQDTLHFTPLV